MKSIRYLIAFSIVALLALLVFVVNIFPPVRQQATTPLSNKKLKVITTFFPLYDFTRHIAQDRVELDILFTQTPEIASFSPQDIQKINSADLIIKNGVGLEAVLDELIKSSDNKGVRVIDTSIGVQLKANQDREEIEEHGQWDPHIWLYPKNAIQQVKNITAALASIDQSNKDFYNENTERYIKELENLDRDITWEVASLPKKDFVAFHSAFSYFAESYGLRQAAVIEEFPGKEPSPRYIAEVMEIIRRAKISAIFAEPQFSPKIVQTIAQDLGITVRILNPIESGDAQKDTYISLMRANLEELKKASK